MNDKKNITVLSIARYPAWAIPFAIISMALFRLPLWLDKNNSFWKLMGSGRNGTFDKTPDWRQWAILCVRNGGSPGSNDKGEINARYHGNFIDWYQRLFRCTIKQFILEPIEGHGLWDGKEVFGQLPRKTAYNGEIAVLTRATIRLSRLQRFWSHVEDAASPMSTAEGFILSYGIGEIPWIKQATFSLWKNKDAMKAYAYNSQQHANVINLTRKENWYSEEMFVRFKILHKPAEG